MVRAQLGACADSLLCRAAWRPQTACQIYDCLWADAQGRLEVELELHADAGVNVGVVAAADALVHLRAVLDDELGAKADAQVVLLDAGKGAYAVVAVHGNLFVDVAQDEVVLAPFLRLAVYAEADAVLAPAFSADGPCSAT